MPNPYESRTYFSMSLDPIHVGTGGYRLGRVDNTIVREPSTGLPKIPGSSLAGVSRACTALAVQAADPGKKRYLREVPVAHSNGEEAQPKTRLESCAGKGADNGEGHCGGSACEVCTTYGFSKTHYSFQGLAQFGDAQIVFFPVSSMFGPVWVTSPSVLAISGIAFEGIEPNDWLGLSCRRDDQFVCFSPSSGLGDHVNLGWLFIERVATATLTRSSGPPAVVPGPAAWSISGLPLSSLGIRSELLARLVIVADPVFSQVVNDNLEVRTSVAINPATGAAEEGALFTYEAMPRGTILSFDITVSDPMNFRIPGPAGPKRICKNEVGDAADIDWVFEQVNKGLALFKVLGVGGMATRGMGRLDVFVQNSVRRA